MNPKAVTLAILLTALMVLAGLAAVGPAGASDGETRESRQTSIDGEFKDTFDDATNLTLKGDAGVLNGDLLVDRTLMRDEFDRFQLAPWEAVEGTPRISAGKMLTNGTEMEGAKAKVAMDLHDLEIRFDFSPGFMTMGAPRVYIDNGAGTAIWGTYNRGLNEVQMWLWNASGNFSLGKTNALLTSDEWYSAAIVVEGDDITMELGPSFVVANRAITGNFTSLTLGVGPGDSAAWDNVTVSKLGGTGTAITDPVNLPPDTYWASFSITIIKDPSVEIQISLVDPATQLPFQGLSDITSSYLNLEDRLDPLQVSAISLKVRMTASGTNSPKVSVWKVTWKGDAPIFNKPIPPVTLNEDEDKYGVIDLRQHFDDEFTHDDNLTFSIPWMSESQHVRPVVDGHMLGFELDTKDWYGTEYYTVRCSDGILHVDSVQATVSVMPVDDPPLVRPFGRVSDVYEDEPYDFDIGPYLEDVDTPVEVLKVRALSDYATVNGHVITLLYDFGGTDRVELLVSDYTNDVTFYMDVSIKNVDDAPIFDPIEKVAVFEDQERTLDISDLIYDEDTPMEELLIDLEGGDRYISLDGFVITLFYDDTGGEFEYTILVSDENSTVSQVLEVSVRAVNDEPTVVSVGEMVPVDGEVSWTMTEGNTTELKIEVVDEESTGFQYTVVSDLDGAIMVG
ncbi:MAG: hypothetical protein JSW25_08025, partial [Thermoplasmata archaeon]